MKTNDLLAIRDRQALGEARRLAQRLNELNGVPTYRFHHAAEELFMIISGEATLRMPEGFEKVAEGDIIFFEEGPASAHQLYNHSNSPCVYLDLRTTFGIDVCEYPDSGKINILPFMQVFEKSSKVDYYKGENNPEENWPN